MEKISWGINMNVKDLIRKIRLRVVVYHPFYGNLLLSIPYHEDSTIPTMCTDGECYRFNPSFIQNLSVDEASGVLLHEVLHIALGHIARGFGKNPVIWNLAADAIVNEIISRRTSFKLPNGVVRLHDIYKDSYVGDVTVEEVYNYLMKKLKPSGEGPGSQSGGGSGDQDDKGSGKEGSDKDFYDGFKRIDDHKYPTTAAKAREVYEKTCEWITRARRLSKGDDPLGALRDFQSLHEAVIPWQVILSGIITDLIPTDYTFFPPKRWHNGFALPRAKKEGLDVVIALDTSGSISSEDLRDFASEVKGILELYPGISVKVICCDAEAYGVQEVSDVSEIKVKGGGGTDFRPVFEKLEHDPPKLLIYFTDGFGTFPSREPPYLVLWVGTRHFNPPFGSFILLKK
jgi:predicted metal-dependent peptidase